MRGRDSNPTTGLRGIALPGFHPGDGPSSMSSMHCNVIYAVRVCKLPNPPDDLLKAPAHPRLRLDQIRLECSEVRHVAGMRQELQ
jgi:hypothetical protein